MPNAGTFSWKSIEASFDVSGVNPRMVHCYTDEDSMGLLKRFSVLCENTSDVFQ